MRAAGLILLFALGVAGGCLLAAGRRRRRASPVVNRVAAYYRSPN